MSVVLRCPNCGTTQATAGECEACHDAQVRYFCTNHEPGIWLTGPTCPQCAALREAAARPTASTTPPTLDAPSRQPLWEKLIRGALVARRATPAPEPRPAGGWLLKLVLRLVVIAMLLVVALAGGLYLLVRSMD